MIHELKEIGSMHGFTLQPHDDRILVRRVRPNEYKGPIIIPDIVKPSHSRGIVVAVGPGKRDDDGVRRPLAVRPKDIVIFGQYTDFEEGDLALIQEADVIGIESNE